MEESSLEAALFTDAFSSCTEKSGSVNQTPLANKMMTVCLLLHILLYHDEETGSLDGEVVRDFRQAFCS